MSRSSLACLPARQPASLTSARVRNALGPSQSPDSSVAPAPSRFACAVALELATRFPQLPTSSLALLIGFADLLAKLRSARRRPVPTVQGSRPPGQILARSVAASLGTNQLRSFLPTFQVFANLVRGLRPDSAEGGGWQPSRPSLRPFRAAIAPPGRLASTGFFGSSFAKMRTSSGSPHTSFGERNPSVCQIEPISTETRLQSQSARTRWPAAAADSRCFLP